MQITCTAYYSYVSDSMDKIVDESSRIISTWADSSTLPLFQGVLSTVEMLQEMEELMNNIKLKHIGLCFQFFFT